MIKVSILTEAGQGIGLGHLNRCIALAEGFKNESVRPIIFVNNRNLPGLTENYKIIKCFDWLKNQKLLFKYINDSDLTVVDSYLAGEDLYNKVRRLTKVAVYIDDMKRLDYPPGIVVNTALNASSLGYPRHPKIKYLFGKDYALLRKEFWNVVRKKRCADYKKILITVGGEDKRNLIPKILGMLNVKYPHLIKYIAIGRSFSNLEKIKKSIDKKCKLIYFPDAKRMREIMLKSDLAVSSGGQTLFELARIGLPTVVIATAENQTNNIRGWQDRGCIDYAGKWNAKNIMSILSTKIDQIMQCKKRSQSAAFIDGKGAVRLARYLINESSYSSIHLSHAKIGDCYSLWLWRNDPRTRKWSFNNQKINYDKHCGWFKQKLNDPKSVIYIARNAKKERIGQVRFDFFKKSSVYINVNLNPKFFGIGLGTMLIKVGTNLFLRENPAVRAILAKIIAGNTRSVNAFKNAGYSFLARAKADNIKTIILKFNKP
jgi:spore coat polysaccharide biosynthesis predicted glycosyltransferase SpsG/RimJ/RimL family protein N-acetyltransferase